MQIEAVLFDLDGTLVDSLGDLGSSVNHVLADLGLPTHSIDSYRLRIGDGSRTMLSRALPEDRQELLDQAVESFKKYYRVHCLDQTRTYPGIDSLLDHLKERGCPMAIFTNKPHPLTTHIVESLFPIGLFDTCLGQQDDFPKKPDPTGALRIAETISCRPECTLFLGDSAIDMHTATAAGMVPVGATWGFRSRNELIESGAKHIINNPHELLDLI
jgi:phosphoglycolate phosphatase